MHQTFTRRAGLAAIAATAVTAGALLIPGSSAIAAVAADDEEALSTNNPEGSTETLTVAQDAQLTAAGYGQPIHRADVWTRALNWYSRDVPYSQTAYAWDVNHGKTYRTDCSGFVSMCWMLKVSKTTWTLDDVSHQINWNDLLRGDALVRPHHHTVLFDKWVDASTKASMRVVEENGHVLDMNARNMGVVLNRNLGFVPMRYNGIRA